MTSNRAQLKALIDQLDLALRDSSTPEAQARQQAAIAETRSYLVELQRSGKASQVESQEASAQQVLQAVVQEMGYLRANMIQPLREEITQLHDERKQLASTVRQLQQQQQQLQTSQQQAMQQQMLQDFMQSLMARLQDQMTTQVVQAIALMQPQLSGDPDGEGVPQLSGAQQVEQLRALQATSNELMLKMDSTMRVVFDSLQSTIDSYGDSLGQGLEKMHSLGQQGETLFAALVNRLATQLGREASNYLNHSLSEGANTQLGSTAPLGERLLSTKDGQASLVGPGDLSDDQPPEPDRSIIGDAVAPDSVSAAEDLSADQIDQILRQNLPQTPSEMPLEMPVEMPLEGRGQGAIPQAAPAQLDTDDLIDQLLQDLEADIDAIGNDLSLDLEGVDLTALTESPEGDSDEAIALFELGDDGVTVNEAAVFGGEEFEPLTSEQADLQEAAEEPASSGSPPAADNTPADSPSAADGPPAADGDSPPEFSVDPSDEIASFYAEFRAATEGPSEGGSETQRREPDPQTPFELSAANLDAAGETTPDINTADIGATDLDTTHDIDRDIGADGADVDVADAGGESVDDESTDITGTTDIDTITRLSDLIDPNLLIQMGMEDTSGTSNSFTMASLGEDLLPTSGDSAKPFANFDIDIDQLTADLSRIEGSDRSPVEPDVERDMDPDTVEPDITPEDGAPVSGFLSPDDAFFAVDSSPAGLTSPLPETDPEEPAGEPTNESAPPLGPFSQPAEIFQPLPEMDDDEEGREEESTADGPIFGELASSEPAPPEVEVDPFAEDESTIDEIAALFAALEGSEDSPSDRSAIAEQTLADLLKPAGEAEVPVNSPASDNIETTPWTFSEIEDDEKKK